MTGSTLVQVQALLQKYYLNSIRNQGKARMRDFIGPIMIGFGMRVFSLGNDVSDGSFANTLPIIFPLYLNGMARSFVYDVVNDKTEKYKEYLKINGVSELSYTLSMLISGYIKFTIAALIILIAMLIIGVNTFVTAGGTNFFWELFLVSVFYGITTVNFLMVYTTFFSTPKLCSDTCGLLIILFGYVFYLVQYANAEFVYYLGSLLPQCAVNIAVYNLSTQGNEGNTQNIYPVNATWLMFLFDWALYLGLYLWLERVLPNEYGIRRPVLFCLKRKSTRDRSKSVGLSMGEVSVAEIQEENMLAKEAPFLSNDMVHLNQSDEDYSSAKFHEKFTNPLGLKPRLVIRDLVKTFADSNVVNKLSLTIYERQIFSLLGHNGAGKTTTINMLTGILESDGGHIYYDGEDFKENVDSIRSRIGLCAQKDLLYPNMTVEEHLEMIAKIRGVPLDRIAGQVQFVIDKVGLRREVGKASSTLSGGNKRKLSLGMAIIGDVQFIFLDEPTSGLDPDSRLTIQNILRQLRQDGKTILLTTHYLDEADLLSDRIAVLTKGKLFSLGTSSFMKKHFGEGYHLVITPKFGVHISEFEKLRIMLVDIVKKFIPTANKNEQTPPDILKFALPLNYQHKFGELFAVLEQHQEIQISMEMTTLEDAFINIGLEEERFLGTDGHLQEQISIRDDIAIPASITKNPEYVFLDQFKAIYLRKILSVIRSPQSIIMTTLPLVFIALGVTLAKSQLSSNTADNSDANQAGAIFFSLYCTFGFAMNAAVYCGFPVYEREQKLRYALKVMGCRTTPYWTGTFVADYSILGLLMIFLIVFTAAEQILYIQDNLGQLFILLLCFGAGALTASYLYGFLYTTSSTAYKTIGIFNIFILLMVPWFAVLYIQSVDNYSFTVLYAVKIVGYTFGPYYTLFEAILTLSPFAQYIVGEQFLTKWWQYCLVLLLQSSVYLALTIYFESRKYNLRLEQEPIMMIPQNDNIPVDVNEINAEASRVANPSNDNPIKVLNLKKAYPNGFLGVNNVSFGVEKGQIFGLLGPNGAGKSTCFNVLTALIPRTSGSVKLHDTEIDNDLAHIFKEVGICPQFDCLWENLTVKEHLYLFGRLKGLHGHELEENLDYYIRVMTLEDHVKKKSAVLSGGNKRKLCVSNALIGSPSMQFFDEPSTGLDPVARKALYTTLTQNLQARNSSIILTTHSMPEAESLCHKIGILVNGRLVCFGSTPYLKNKYGAGYKIEIKKSKEFQGDLMTQSMGNVCPNAIRLVNINQDNSEHFQAPLAGFSFSRAFTNLENMKNQKMIEDFAIYNTTLEQVFIAFSKYQNVIDRS